ncbi:DNA-methyltransferase [Natrinema thermotolerans]|uniref:DNA-methyltransferase n=1 Tax=Natrinema thermotolerans TaxID=121872 RepID=UPI000A9FB7E1|nr:site-specific DNA-methyltransferase [Natrinema thermotolerans]
MGRIDDWTNNIHQGDAVDTLGEMPDSSVHCAMTSPPYFGLRDYGEDGQIGLEDSLNEYIDALVEVGDELRRVLRSDGSWWLNLGDSYGSKPGWGSQSDDVGGHDAAVDHSRSGFQRKSKMLVPHRVAIALQESGWIVRSDAVWSKPNPMPDPAKDRLNETKEFVFHLVPESEYWFDLDAIREPYAQTTKEAAQRGQSKSGQKRADANSPGNHHLSGGLHDESKSRREQMHPSGKNPGDIFDVSVKSFPEAHFAVYPPELCEKPVKSSCPPKVCADCGTPYERVTEVVERYVAGGSPNLPEGDRGFSDRQGTCHADREGMTQAKREMKGWDQACDCETESTEPGIVLDPFAGAGTTCLVAKRLGRRFAGIDLNPDYVAMAQKRVGVTVEEPERLLDESETSLLAFTDGGTDQDLPDS